MISEIIVTPDPTRPCSFRKAKAIWWQRLGVWRVLFRNQLMPAGYRIGIPAASLARHYRGG